MKIDCFYDAWPIADIEDYVEGLGFVIALRDDLCPACGAPIRLIMFSDDLKGANKHKEAFHRSLEEGQACKFANDLKRGARC